MWSQCILDAPFFEDFKMNVSLFQQCANPNEAQTPSEPQNDIGYPTCLQDISYNEGGNSDKEAEELQHGKL